MKIIKNKFMLSLGAAMSVIAPVASIVACGESNVKDISDSEKQQRETLNKSQQLIQTKYQEYLISKVSTTHKQFGADIKETELKDYSNLKQDFKKEISKFIKRNIYSSATYLTTFADKLIHTVDQEDKNKKFFQYGDLVNDGFYAFYLSKTDVEANPAQSAKIDNLINKYMKTIWNNNISNFKNSFYQYVISSYYLDTDKDKWTKVFIKPESSERITGNEGFLEASKFVLGLKTLRAKLAFDWTVSLDDASSKAYAGATKKEADIDAQLKKSATAPSIYSAATTTLQRSLIPGFDWDNTSTTKPDDIWSFVKENKDIIGFNGITSKAAFASDSNIRPSVDTTRDSYDKNFVGYVNPEKTSELVEDRTKDIKLTTPSNSKVSLEKIIMILPQYNNGYLKLDFLKSSNATDPFDILKQIIIANDSSIYNEAVDYYSSKDNVEFNDGIRLKFSKEAYELEKLAIDSFKFAFVEKNEDK